MPMGYFLPRCSRCDWWLQQHDGNIQMVGMREVGIVRRFLMFAGFMDIAASL